MSGAKWLWLGGASVACLSVVQVAVANTGTMLPMSQYRVGTEQTNTTTVPNGKFETTPQNATWIPIEGSTQYAAPINPPAQASSVGAFAAQALKNASSNTDRVGQTLPAGTFVVGQSYVLSAYMWNFGTKATDPSGILDFAAVEIRDPTNEALLGNISIAPNGSDGGSAANGYFVYATFDGFSQAARIDLKFGLNGDPATEPTVFGQIDNVSITPASSFVPPQAVPEPGCLGVVALIGAGVMHRRGRRCRV
jgi:hypothetical protein